MQKEKSLLLGRNVFTEAFHQFDDERFFQRLEEQVKPQSYFQKYKGFKNVILTLSYLFNIVSAFTASYLVFWCTKWLTGFVLAAYALSALFLFFLEKLKRKSSSEFFQVWFFEKKLAAGWLALSASLFAASVSSTYYGTDRATWDFAPPASVITQDSTLSSLYTKLVTTEGQITEARETRWKGTTTRTSQKTIRELTKQKSALLREISEREQTKASKNERIETVHTAETKITAATLAWLAVLFEVFFECCIAYIWYYYYRSFIERKIIDSPSITAPLSNGQVRNQEPDENALLELFKQLQTAMQGKEQVNFKDLTTNGKQSGHNGSHGEILQDFMLPIGFYTPEQRQQQAEKLFKQQISAFKQPFLENGSSVRDLYTVPHRDFKTGQIRHVNMANINNMIGIYQKRVRLAHDVGNEKVLKNRGNKLAYWLSKKNDLVQKFTSIRQDACT